ncbi:amidohydrolase [Xylariaceae sp. FL0255]|nr:amidohydrolase [Xylariaceae sp. FL0255]
MRSTALFTTLSGLASTALSTSLLLSGGTIIAFDESSKSLNVIRDGSVLVTDDRIAALWDAEETKKKRSLPKDTEIVDCTNKIISPGFVDTHRHGWQTGLKTLASNTTLAEYKHKWASGAAGPSYTREDVYVGQLAGLLESLNAGVTTTLDHAHNIWSTDRSLAGLEASIESGGRVFWAAALDGKPDYPLKQQIKDWKSFKGKIPKDSPVELGVAWDYWDLGTPEDTGSVVKLIKDEKPAVLTIHWLGGPWILESSPSLVHSHGLLDTPMPVVFSHGVGVNSKETSLLRQYNQFLSITPESEMHYGHSHIHSHLAQDQAALGIDTHFAYSTDLLTQARLWLQRTRSRLFDEVIERWEIPRNNPMSANQAFLLATRQGGLALHRPDLGVISVGAKADLAIFNGRSPALLGWVDPVAAIILHASVGDITDVLVDGKFQKRDGKLVYPEYEKLAERFLESCERLREKVLARPEPTLEGRFFHIGEEFGDSVRTKVLKGEGGGYGGLFL